MKKESFFSHPLPFTLHPSPFPYMWLSWKIIFFKGNPTIQKFSMATAVGAIGVGMASLLATIGIMNGFHREIKARILGLSPHVFVGFQASSEKQLIKETGAVEEILRSRLNVESAPFAIGQALLRTPKGSMGIIVKAVDPLKEKAVTRLDRLLRQGTWFGVQSSQKTKDASREPVPLLLGLEVAKGLGAYPQDNVALIVPSASNSLIGLPRIIAGKVSGIFESGYYEYDSSLVFVPLDFASRLWGDARGAVNALFWLGIRASDSSDAEQISQQVAKLIAGRPAVSQILTWGQMNKSLFSALKLEKLMLTFVLSLIIFVASVSLSSNLIMIAAQKTKMIGSLRSLGVSRRELLKLMLSVGAVLGSLGILVGWILTSLVALILLKTNWVRLPAEIYMIEKVPISLGPGDILAVMLFTLMMCLIAGALPAYRTSKMDVSQILRYG